MKISLKKDFLTNYMCNIIQFIIPSPTVNISAAHLAQIFMADIVFSFRMCSVVLVDDGSSFKGVFTALCNCLDLTYWCLSRDNHKGNSIEQYPRFLNKTQSIAGNNPGTHDTYI